MLDFVPVTHTQWSLWRDAHPDTIVLDKRGRYQSDVYTSYYRGGSAGVLGETRSDGRLNRKALVVGVELGSKTKAYPFQILLNQPVVNDSMGDEDTLVYFDRNTDTALVYDRKIDGRRLSFRLAEQGVGPQAILVDNETGTRWMALTGLAIEGELEGKTLSRAPSHLSFWFAWKDWNPDTEVYFGPEDNPDGDV